MDKYRLIDAAALEAEASSIDVWFERRYERYFPACDREARTDILSRLHRKGDDEGFSSFLVFAGDGVRLAAGMVIDWYPAARSVELCYIVRNNGFMLRGEGLAVVEAGMGLFCDRFGDPGYVFLAAPRTDRAVRDRYEGMDAAKLRTVLSGWGARVVPVGYSAFPVVRGGAMRRGWDLMALPMEGIPSQPDRSAVVAFLREKCRRHGLDPREADAMVYGTPFRVAV